MTTRRKKPAEYSEAELQKMAEPITVTVNKLVAGKKTPIEVPPGPGQSVSGQGWSKDMVRQLAPFLRDEWSGGGMYQVEVTDTAGQTLNWELYFHPDQVPERTPPSIRPAPVPANGAPPPVSHNPQYLSQVASTYRTVAAPVPGMPAAAAQTPYQMTPFGWQPPYQTPSRLFSGGGVGAISTSDQAMKEREERLKLEAKIEQERQQRQHEKEITGVQHELRKVQEQLAAGPSREESAQVKSLNDKIAQLEQQSSNQQMMQMFQQQNQQTLDLIKEVQRSNDQKIETLQRAITEANNNKTDPMITMMMQNQSNQVQLLMQMMQQQSQAQVESARINAEAQKAASANALGPREMVELFRSSNQGAEQMANAYGRAWELMANGVESLLAAQGPNVHPAVAMIGSAAEGGLGIAQRYLEMKEQEVEANARTEQVKAQLQAQAAVTAEKIRVDAMQRHPLPQIEGAEGDEGEEAAEGADEAPSPQDIKDAERELFGVAYDTIHRLRRGAKSGALKPPQCAAAILQGIDHYVAKGDIPPVFDLWKEQRFADFVDCLLANMPYPYREEVTQLLIQGVNNLRQQAANQAAQAPPPVG